MGLLALEGLLGWRALLSTFVILGMRESDSSVPWVSSSLSSEEEEEALPLPL